jgi:hypothetical protein
MLAMRGGLSVGSLLTGLSASLLGVNHALLINGVLAIAAQIFIGREWLRSTQPDCKSSIRDSNNHGQETP